MLNFCFQNMKKMYGVAGLVHADLSEYNMLWFNEQLYFIDVSQAVEKQHPLAMVFLLRDCGNVVDVSVWELPRHAVVASGDLDRIVTNSVTCLEMSREGIEFGSSPQGDTRHRVF